jgi:hypothetical protein
LLEAGVEGFGRFGAVDEVEVGFDGLSHELFATNCLVVIIIWDRAGTK